ncbi:MAG TPA: cupin domain-containing protein [Planctomycetota bacterium]|nr:cupin domain-containing protein [Planctomycetota bacterium]
MSTATRDRTEFLRFITKQDCEVSEAHWGHHDWCCKPEMTGAKHLILVRVTMPPGRGHQFHRHPAREEIIYVLDGLGEQWVDRERRILKPGETAFIPRNIVHGIYNSSKKPVTFLAMLSPAVAKGPFLIDCYDDKPWRELRKPFRYE